MSCCRWHQDGILQVDDLPEVTGRTEGYQKTLDLSISTFIGQVPSDNRQVLSNTGTACNFNKITITEIFHS